MLRCPECNGDDLIGGGFHSPNSIERCRWCAAPAVEVPWPPDEGKARAELAREMGPEWCSECETYTGHLLFGNVCANCRNAAMRGA